MEVEIAGDDVWRVMVWFRIKANEIIPPTALEAGGLTTLINGLISANEVIGQALRKTVR